MGLNRTAIGGNLKGDKMLLLSKISTDEIKD